jgi:hypothetical protein
MVASIDHTVAYLNSAPTHLQITYCIFFRGTVQAQAATHWKFGDLETAYELARQVQGGIETVFGSRSEMLPAAQVLLGLLLTSMGQLREAEQILMRSQTLATIIWGQGCVASSNALFALAMVQLAFFSSSQEGQLF